MEKKVCTKCKEEKDVTEFYFRNDTKKFRLKCKKCSIIDMSVTQKVYRENNMDKIKEYREKNKDKLLENKRVYYQNNKDIVINRVMKYYHNNSDKISERKRKYYRENLQKYKIKSKEYSEKNREKINERVKIYTKKNKEKIKEKLKVYRENNKDSINLYQKKYRENNKEKLKECREKNKEKRRDYEKYKRLTDPIYKLKQNISRNIRNTLSSNGYSKNSRTHQILGCTYDEFKTHIELQFKEWMNWDNYGKYNGEERYGWDLDHIIPMSYSKCEEDIIRLNHHSNIQPLCSYVNRYVKRDKI
jgi:hypothetical protein